MANKQELLEEAKQLGLEVTEDTNYNDLASMVAAKKKENETAKEEVQETAPFILLTSDLEHNVTRVLDKDKGLSLFKFGRKVKDEVIPTRVPKEYGEALFRSYPGKYEKVDVPKQYAKKLPEYFEMLIDAQDEVDHQKKEAELKKELEEKQKQLKELQAQGKVKKIVRE